MPGTVEIDVLLERFPDRTREAFDHIWTENARRNSALTETGRFQGLHDRCDGRPCFLVGAGPSLVGNVSGLKDALARLADCKPVVVAVDRAYPFLRGNGIVPTFVVSIDGGEEAVRFFQGWDTGGTVLVANASCHPDVPPMFEKRTFVVPDGDYMSDCESAKVTLGLFPGDARISAAGLVGAWSLVVADWIGCDPLIFLGYDCSVAKGHGLGYEHIDLASAVPLALIALRRWLTDVGIPSISARRPGTRVWNCTEGGILAKGCEVFPLEEAVSRLTNATDGIVVERNMS